MIQEDRQLLEEWARNLSRSVTIGLTTDESETSRMLSTFAENLASRSSRITLRKDFEGAAFRPAIVIGPYFNIYCQAMPTGNILSELLKIITSYNGKQESPVSDLLKQLRTPMPLKIYIGRGCPFCPQMVSRLFELAAGHKLVSLGVIDAGLFQETAAADRVRSVPLTILDDQFRWTGVVDTSEIVQLGLSRDPAEISAGCLRQLLESGKASHAAEMMIERDKIFPALLELLAHPRWSVRLGAMVVVEYLVSDKPELAAGICHGLWEKFDSVDTQAQGDMVYTLGLLATPEALGKIRQVLKNTTDPSVKEAALEALQTIMEKQ